MMLRPLLMTALAATSLLCAAPEQAQAQGYWRPWMRPRVIFMPRVVPAMIRPPMMVPQVYVQPGYPQPYYYPAPRVYVQPAPQVYVQPPQVYVQPPQVYVQQPQVYSQQPQVYSQPLPPPPVYMQPPPPPPVYMQQPPPPPVYMQPQQPIYSPPMAPPPPPPTISYYRPLVTPVSQWRSRFGIGARFAGTVNTDQGVSFGQLGFGGELLYRVHRHIVMEMASEYQKRVDNGFDRYDVPVTLGMRLHIGAPDWVVSPYFVAAGGAAYANMDYLRSHDQAWFVDGQLGGGLEIRLGRHFALSADLRADARHRMTKPDEATAATVSIDGKPFAPMGDSYGAQFRLGAALYF